MSKNSSLLPGSQLRKLISLGPASVWLILFLLIPVTFMSTVSFMQVNPQTYDIIWEPTIGNYIELFLTDTFAKVVLTSFKIAILTTLITLLVAYPFAYTLATRVDRHFSTLIFLVLLPFFTIYLLRIYSWILMFGNNGLLNQILMQIGILDTPSSLFGFGQAAVITGLVHAYFPYMLLSLYAGMEGIDLTLIEAARDLGASRFACLKDILIPLTLPGIVSGVIFVFIPALGAYISPQFLGKGSVLMIGPYIESQVGFLYQIGYGSAAALLIIVTLLVTLGIAFRYLDMDQVMG